MTSWMGAHRIDLLLPIQLYRKSMSLQRLVLKESFRCRKHLNRWCQVELLLNVVEFNLIAMGQPRKMSLQLRKNLKKCIKRALKTYFMLYLLKTKVLLQRKIISITYGNHKLVSLNFMPKNHLNIIIMEQLLIRSINQRILEVSTIFNQEA